VQPPAPLSPTPHPSNSAPSSSASLRFRSRYLLTLAVLLAAVITRSGIGAHYPHDWLLENALVLGFVPLLVFTYRRFPLSLISYTLIFLFLCFHELGAHWTYAKVPYNDWTRALFGTSLNEMLGLERNHFDRAVHFLYGLLLAYPIRELFVRVADVRGFWGYFLPLDLTMSTSMIFELFEWAAAILFGGELGAAYLGTQGDIWDAHADMALASLGALIAMLIVAFINKRKNRDFARDLAESLRVKRAAPLGEVELARLKNASKE
jgi:putative membrane protein